MKKNKIYTVSSTEMNGFTGYAIKDENGDFDTFFPYKTYEPKGLGYCETYEISAEFFLRLRMINSVGAVVKFE